MSFGLDAVGEFRLGLESAMANASSHSRGVNICLLTPLFQVLSGSGGVRLRVLGGETSRK